MLKIDFASAVPGLDTRGLTVAQCATFFQVEFSSLDFLLHTNALLSTINFLTSIVPSEITTGRRPDTKKQAEKAEPGRIGALLFGVWGCGLWNTISDACGFHCVQHPKRPEMAVCSA